MIAIANPSINFCNDFPTKESITFIIKPCIAELNLLNAPSSVSPTVSAITAAAPLACSNLIVKFSILCEPLIIVWKAATCLKSTSFIISAFDIPSAFNCVNAFCKSSELLTVKPNFFDKADVGSCIFKKIFLKDVPAIDASIPASVNVPITAVVASNVIFAPAAIGATLVIDVWNFSISKAELVNATAITSATLPVSPASNAKPLTAAPATIAALAKPVSVAVASNKVASCAFSISFVENPNLPKFVCSSATCWAVKKVDLPKSSAVFDSFKKSSVDAPVIALTLAIWNSKSLKVLIELLITLLICLKAATAANIPAVILLNPKVVPLVFLSKLSNCFCPFTITCTTIFSVFVAIILTYLCCWFNFS